MIDGGSGELGRDANKKPVTAKFLSDTARAFLKKPGPSTIIAAIFLPTVRRYGYSTMFFIFAGCTVVYFVTATFFLPETKGKTLEEIEEHFEGKRK